MAAVLVVVLFAGRGEFGGGDGNDEDRAKNSENSKNARANIAPSRPAGLN